MELLTSINQDGIEVGRLQWVCTREALYQYRKILLVLVIRVYVAVLNGWLAVFNGGNIRIAKRKRRGCRRSHSTCSGTWGTKNDGVLIATE